MKPEDWAAICRAARRHYVPLQVRAELLAPVVCEAGYVHLDAVMAAHTPALPSWTAEHAPQSSDVLDDIQLPVQRIDGIWCCSALWVGDPHVVTEVTWVQRPSVEYADLVSAGSLNVGIGPTRARRKTARAYVAREMTGVMIAAPEWVRRILRHVSFVGKLGRQGYGRIRSWEVVEVAEAPWREWGGIVRRPLPNPNGQLQGVRPPYWYRPWWVPASSPGAPVAAL